MAFTANKIRQGVQKAAAGYSIDNSLRFNDDDSPYLDRTFGTPTDGKKWVWSSWVKKTAFDNSNRVIFQFDSTYLQFTRNGLSKDIVFAPADKELGTTAKFRDGSAWFHIVGAVDTTQSTAADRSMLYINGERVTDFSSQVTQTLNATSASGASGTKRIGSDTAGNGNLDGYLAEVHFIDGQSFFSDTSGTANSSFNINSFGETDADYKHWKPIEYTGTYGNNGFHLDFKVAGTGTTGAGKDVSGEGNHWSTSGIASTDQMLDSPTNNFCTISPLGRVKWLGTNSFPTLSNGNLQYDVSSSGGMRDCTMGFNSGKWYWESRVGSPQPSYVGVRATRGIEDGMLTYSIRCDNRNIYNVAWNATSQTTIASGVTSSFSAGDIIAVAADMDSNVIKWYKNNSLIYTYNSIVADTYVPCAGGAGTASTWVINFGQDSSFAGNKTAQGNQDGNSVGDFYYTPPTGFLALCTNNLPAPAVKPQENFNTVLYTGTGGSQSITGVGFQPDFIFHSMRSSDRARNLFDSVRGLNSLSSSHTGNEGNGLTAAQSGLTSYDSDGATIIYRSGVNHEVNENTKTGVLWNWYCPTTFSGNTDGDITSSGRKNTDAGFSIVSYTGTGTGSSPTVGHGLGAVPDVVLVKRRDSGSAWVLQHSYDTTKYFQFQDVDAASTGAAVFDNVAPTASVFTVNSTNGVVNASGGTYIAYCFRSVEGYSKMGSYIGNGISDGTFVYTGFRPAYVMIKRATSTYAWLILDVKRDTYNITDEFLNADDSSVEWNGVGSYQIDIVSNGFKVRSGSSGLGSTGDTYIFLSFAEYPFKYTNAR